MQQRLTEQFNCFVLVPEMVIAEGKIDRHHGIAWVLLHKWRKLFNYLRVLALFVELPNFKLPIC
jgi:hypothetical protein